MKKLILLFWLLNFGSLSFGATLPQPYTQTFCNAFKYSALKYNVGTLGSCWIATLGVPHPAHWHSFYVPATFVSVFDQEENSQFVAWPVGFMQMLKSPTVSNMVGSLYGRPDLSNKIAGVGQDSKLDDKGEGDFFLNAHVGPVYFAKEFFDEVQALFWGGIVTPLKGDKCINYSTRMDSIQWQLGLLDKNMLNPTYQLMMTAYAAGTFGKPLGDKLLEGIQGLICKKVKSGMSGFVPLLRFNSWLGQLLLLREVVRVPSLSRG